jgi:uncharacterized protein
VTELQQGVYPIGMHDPHSDEMTQPFWDAALEGRLVAPKCTKCGTFVIPPQPFCFECQNDSFEWTQLPGTGTIYTFTIVRHPLHPGLADVVPYVSGIVELDGTQGAGARMITNFVDCDPETVAIGDKVRIVWEKVSDTYAAFRFAVVT